MERRERTCKQPLDEKLGYWEMKEEGLNYTLWSSRFGRGYGPLVRQTDCGMNEYLKHTCRCSIKYQCRTKLMLFTEHHYQHAIIVKYVIASSRLRILRSGLRCSGLWRGVTGDEFSEKHSSLDSRPLKMRPYAVYKRRVPTTQQAQRHYPGRNKTSAAPSENRKFTTFSSKTESYSVPKRTLLIPHFLKDLATASCFSSFYELFAHSHPREIDSSFVLLVSN